ncbi:40S ribosomal protein S3a-like [Papaver somniferum]|uniref:40S ribosomal protein S3a-like n=1 Tax=Papaver somniferum TaxID=3469 RepID=UPI000E6FC447|nr:40S ribosomal protein S3a-like [Papaver somniferum]
MSYVYIASERLKHRVFEVYLADLQNDEDQSYIKMRLRVEDVQGKNVLTNFWTLIEAHVDVKTTNNFTLRMFCIGFTQMRKNQVKRTSHMLNQAKSVRTTISLTCMIYCAENLESTIVLVISDNLSLNLICLNGLAGFGVDDEYTN